MSGFDWKAFWIAVSIIAVAVGGFGGFVTFAALTPKTSLWKWLLMLAFFVALFGGGIAVMAGLGAFG